MNVRFPSPEELNHWADQGAGAAVAAAVAVVLALAVHLLLFKLLGRLTRLSHLTSDELVVEKLRRPMRWSLVAPCGPFQTHVNRERSARGVSTRPRSDALCSSNSSCSSFANERSTSIPNAPSPRAMRNWMRPSPTAGAIVEIWPSTNSPRSTSTDASA